jgi:hypothetical protein
MITRFGLGSFWILIALSPLGRPSILTAQAPVQDPALSRDLITHGEIDQAIRDTVVKIIQAGATVDSMLIVRMNAVDSGNIAWLKAVVAGKGWPGKSLVGVSAAHYAFLIVQHAVQDTAFMASALRLMEQEVEKGEVLGMDVAMLADRVAVHRGQLQRYGTQARIENGRIIMEPIADSAHVDERRAALGLPPLAEYARQLDSMYTAHR